MNIIKTKKGFTLIELIIVIVIIGILSTVSVPIYRKYIAEAAMTEGYTLVGAIARAEVIYANTKGGGKFLKGFYTSGNYSYEQYRKAREIGITTYSGQYKYFCNVYVGSANYDTSKCTDAITLCACGYSDGLGYDGCYEPMAVYTTVYSDGHINDLQECYYEY